MLKGAVTLATVETYEGTTLRAFPTEASEVQDLTDPFGGLRSSQQFDRLVAFMAHQTHGYAPQSDGIDTHFAHESLMHQELK